MGHPAPTVLQRTQKCVEGVPKIPDASPMFHCQFCDQAKQHKAARGKPENNDAYLPGAMFHMDLAFFRGPSNLNEAVHHGAQPSDTTIIKSIDGHVACLTIVDAAIYLNATRDHGLTYWRPSPNTNHPYVDPPTPMSAPSALEGFPETHAAKNLHGYVDSNYGSDRQHRRSISGIVFMLAGATVFYETRHQPTVALSSTEAEFAAAADAGKAALYLRSILNELGVEQLLPTVIYEDNNGARLMTNAQQPTRRMRHVELKQFAVLQLVKDEQIIFGDIGTAYNISDSLTKQTGRTKFHQHHDLLMGRLRPAYARPADPALPIMSKCSFSAYDYINLYDCSNFDLNAVASMGR
jgi:hypothetical protein